MPEHREKWIQPPLPELEPLVYNPNQNLPIASVLAAALINSVGLLTLNMPNWDARLKNFVESLGIGS